MKQAVPGFSMAWGRDSSGEFILGVFSGGQPVLQLALNAEEEASLRAALAGVAMPALVVPGNGSKLL